MKVLFQPAVFLMNRLTYSGKMILTGCIFLIPIVMLSCFLVNEVNEFIDFAAKERQGIVYLTPLKTLLREVQKLRDHALLARNGVASGDVQTLSSAVDGGFKGLEEVEGRLGKELATGEPFAALKGKRGTLKIDQARSDRQVFDAQTAFIADLLNLITLVADNSNLTLDPDIDSYYLMDTVTTKIPALTDALSQANALASSAMSRKALTADEKTELIVIVGQISSLRDAIVKNLQTAFKKNGELTAALGGHGKEIADTTTAFITALQKNLLDTAVIGRMEDVAPLGSQALDVSFKGFDAVVPALDGLLKKRIDGLAHREYLMMSISALAVVIGMYLFIGFYLSVRRGMNGMLQEWEYIADSGDLTRRLDQASRDELGVMGLKFNLFLGRIAAIITQVASSSEQVATSAGQLSMTAERMATGAGQVAMQVESTATAGEQMAMTSSDIARNCTATVEISMVANETATRGAAVVEKALGMMERIADRVRETANTVAGLGGRGEQIGAIVGTIEDIADQTNLLALNAAIEAARAGEQGRGFAVVADEVRALADRTTKATREIAQMIKVIQQETQGAVISMEEGVKEVETGTAEAARSGEALREILQQIGNVTMQMNQIATAAEEQTATTSEISGNMQMMTDVVQQTAQGAQESAAAACQLNGLAEELRRLVGQFKLAGVTVGGK